MSDLVGSMSGDLASLGIKELRKIITNAGLTTDGCVDKSDLVARALEAKEKLASTPEAALAQDAEAKVAALSRAELLPALEAALLRPPSQETALTANECLDRITETLMQDSGWLAELPRDRLLTAILGGMVMGLGGQGGLFAMSCMPLPYAMQECEGETRDLSTLIEAAEDTTGATFFDTLLAGLAKFDNENLQEQILMTLRIWISAWIENDGAEEGDEQEMVSLADGDIEPLMAMLNAGLLPLIVKPMERHPKHAGIVGHCLAVLSGVCGYRPPASVAAIVIGAGAMPRIVAALTDFRGDAETELDMLRAALPVLKCLTRDKAGCRAAADAGAERALVSAMGAYPAQPEMHKVVLQLLARVSSRATNEKHVGKDDRSAEEAIEAVYLY